MTVSVYNKQPTPLIYGDGKTIGGYTWAEGEQADFQHLIDNDLVVLRQNEPIPAPTSEIDVSNTLSEGEDTAKKSVVSAQIKPNKSASIKPMSKPSLTKE